jgi:GABA permease
MSWTARVLVIANKTADAPELVDVMRARVARGPAEFVLVLPQGTATRAEALTALNEALARIRGAGLTAEGQIGDSDPLVAVQEAWDPASFDEVIVSTLPLESSRWLRTDLPRRIANTTSVSVTHVVCTPRAVTVG